MRLLSLCTGMGMMDRAYLDAGFDVVPGCEIDPEMRQMYRLLCGGKPLVEDIADLPRRVRGMRFDGIIGGPPCQAHSSLRAMRAPKFADLTPHVERVLAACRWHFYKFENVVPLDLLMSRTVLLNAMHFYRPHQSRPRWFTYSGSLTPPPRPTSGRRRRSLRVLDRRWPHLRAEAWRDPAGLSQGVEPRCTLSDFAERSRERRALSARSRLGAANPT